MEEKTRTNYHDRTICVNRHFLKLQDDRFIMMKGWWTMNNGISLCESDISGLIYIIRSDGISRVSIDPTISHSINIDQDLNILKMFRFLNKLYVLTIDGKLYQLTHENINTKWLYRHVTEIYNKDLFNMVIEDIYPCRDGSISIKTGGRIYTYLIKRKKWEDEIGPRKIIYGELSTIKTILYDDRIEFKFEIDNNDILSIDNDYFSNITSQKSPPFIKINSNKRKEQKRFQTTNVEITFTLAGIYRDVELSPNEDSIIVLFSKTRQIKEYKPILKLPITTINQYYFEEKLLHGTGDRLLKSNDIIWLLTGAKCSPI